jgi:hypothetical protein
MKMTFTLIYIFLSISLNGNALAAQYQTEAFTHMKERGASLPNVFICGVLGVKTNIEPDSPVLIGIFSKEAKISPKESGLLMSDALTWWDEWSSEHPMSDSKIMWDILCEVPMSNIKRLHLN